MKKFAKSILGVTLLEIMLVLAIAAMIIVMSVRYYQSASSNQQVNGALSMIQAIGAAADGLAQGSGGSYSAALVSTATIKALMPNGIMIAPWGGDVTISSAATTYTITMSETPGPVCIQTKARLNSTATNAKYAVTCSETAVGAMDITYTNN